MIARLARLLKLEPEETRLALAFGAVLFVLTASYTLVKTARDALFLAHMPANRLPYVYLAVGVLTTIAAVAYARVTRGRRALQALEWATWFSAAVLGWFAWGIRGGAHVTVVAFYLWVNIYGLILFSQFWLYANAASDPREAKRTFGMIGTGGIIGGLVGGIVAPVLVGPGGLHSLVLLAAVLLLLAAAALRFASERRRSAMPQEPLPVDDAAGPFRSRYVRWLALGALCSVLVGTLLDYQFKVELQHRNPSPKTIASMFGLFYTFTNLAAIAVQLFVSRWSLRRLGAGWSAGLLPAGLTVGAAAMAFVPGFGAVVGARTWDQVLRISINKPANELLFFPLPAGVRRRAKAWIESGLERLGDAFAGIVILATGMMFGSSVRVVATLMLLLILVWAVAWIRIRRGYVRELGRNLRRLNLDPRGSRISLRESHVLEEMARLVDSPHERIVLHGIELLEESAPEQLRERVPELLDHPVAAVRARALRAIGANATPEVALRVAAMLHDPDPEVRMAALRVQCMVGGAPSLDTAEAFLGSDDPHLRRSALECMVEARGAVEEDRVRRVIERRLDGADTADRVAIAEALGRREPPTRLHELLPPLADDAELTVRNAAMVSAGRAGLRILVPRMIASLTQRHSRTPARTALASFGDRITGTLGDYLADPSSDLALRRELPRVLGDIATPDAVIALMRYRERDDVRLSYRVLKAMNKIRARTRQARFPRDLVSADLEHDVRNFLFAFVHYRSCPIGNVRSAERLLCIALNERMDQALNRIFRRLALIYPADETYAGYRGIVSDNPRLRGNALEYIENVLSAEHAALVLPLVDDSGDAGRLRFADSRFGIRFAGYLESLGAILDHDDAWLAICALYVAGSQREGSLLDHVERQTASNHPHVRATALWAQAALVTA